MRTLKFRAWDTAYKEMWLWEELLETTMQDEDGEKMLMPLKELGIGHIWMQYTGLKDKNGKEIYEGDIVTNTFTNSFGTRATKDVVEYDEYHWGYSPLFEPRDEKFEVIGNIYENPELLKEEDNDNI